MKKIIFILFLLLALPAFANEDDTALSDENGEIKEEVKEEAKEEAASEKQNIDFRYYDAHSFNVRSRWHTSHKQEHYKTKAKAESGLNKNKAEFKNRVQNELRLLQDEYDVLEYRP